MRIVSNLYSTKALISDGISIDRTMSHIRTLQSNGIYQLIPVFVYIVRYKLSSLKLNTVKWAGEGAVDSILLTLRKVVPWFNGCYFLTAFWLTFMGAPCNEFNNFTFCVRFRYTLFWCIRTEVMLILKFPFLFYDLFAVSFECLARKSLNLSFRYSL